MVIDSLTSIHIVKGWVNNMSSNQNYTHRATLIQTGLTYYLPIQGSRGQWRGDTGITGLPRVHPFTELSVLGEAGVNFFLSHNTRCLPQPPLPTVHQARCLHSFFWFKLGKLLRKNIWAAFLTSHIVFFCRLKFQRRMVKQ